MYERQHDVHCFYRSTSPRFWEESPQNQISYEFSGGQRHRSYGFRNDDRYIEAIYHNRGNLPLPDG